MKSFSGKYRIFVPEEKFYIGQKLELALFKATLMIFLDNAKAFLYLDKNGTAASEVKCHSSRKFKSILKRKRDSRA